MEELIKLYLVFGLILLYPFVMVMAVLFLDWGVYSWIVVGCFLAPPIFTWYKVCNSREEKAREMVLHGAGLSYERMEKAREEWIVQRKKEKKV